MTQCQSRTIPSPVQSLLQTGSMAGMTDLELVDRFASHRDAVGDAAFAALVARHGPMVLGVCRHLLGDEHAADDAFQAVFLVLARRAGSIRRPDLLGPWLHGVAARIARKARAQAERRRRREKAEVEMTHVEPAVRGPDPRRLQAEEAAAVHEEVDRLPERYRRAVVLCHFEGLTHAEAARRLGCAPGTVGSLVSRARDMLRSRLSAAACPRVPSCWPARWSRSSPRPQSRWRWNGPRSRPPSCFTTSRARGRRHRLGGGRRAGRRSAQDHDYDQADDRRHPGAGAGRRRRPGRAGFGMLASRRSPAGPSPAEGPRPTGEHRRRPSLPGAVTQPPPWLGQGCAVRCRGVLRRAAAGGERRAAVPGCPLRVRLGDGRLLPRRPRSREPQAGRRAAIGTIRWNLSGTEEGPAVPSPPRRSMPCSTSTTRASASSTGRSSGRGACSRPRSASRPSIPHVQSARQVGRVAA